MSVILLLGWLAQASLDRAVRRIEQGDFTGAEKILAKELAADPGSARGHYLLGYVRFRTGRIKQAAESLREAARLAPRDAETWKLLGMADSAAGDFEGAVEPYEKACRLSQFDPSTCYYLGRNYYVLNQFQLSVKVFRQALNKAPENWRLHRGLGLALEAMAENDEAEEHLRKSVRLSGRSTPAELDPRTDLGGFYYRRGRTREAIEVLERELKDHPGTATAHFELARCLAQIQQNEKAVQHLKKALQSEPENWPAHQLLGKIYIRLGKTDEGRRHLEIARRGIVADTNGSRTVR